MAGGLSAHDGGPQNEEIRIEIYFTDRTLTGKLDEVPRSGDQTPKTRLIGVGWVGTRRRQSQANPSPTLFHRTQFDWEFGQPLFVLDIGFHEAASSHRSLLSECMK
jgi:hypothetical protein